MVHPYLTSAARGNVNLCVSKHRIRHFYSLPSRYLFSNTSVSGIFLIYVSDIKDIALSLMGSLPNLVLNRFPVYKPI